MLSPGSALLLVPRSDSCVLLCYLVTFGSTSLRVIDESGPIMNFNDQNRSCHAERSEASVGPSRQTLPLRYAQGFGSLAQGDKSFPILLIKFHNRGPTTPIRMLHDVVKPH